jgi:hypothetical protein
VAEFRNYRQLSQQFVEVNTQICELRPVTEATPSAQKKTSEAIQKELTGQVEPLPRIILRDRKATGRLDLESVETAIRAAMHQAGAMALTQLLQFEQPSLRGDGSVPERRCSTSENPNA